MILKLENISREFHSGVQSIEVLSNVNLEVEEGETVAIVGPSGSGKTTLLGICAGLDIPSSGSVELVSHKLELLNQDERAALRRDNIGFIFQNFELIPTLSALENVSVPLELQGRNDAADFAKDYLDKVGLQERVNHYPNQLSGGEQQRVAIARAFAHEPKLVFADEPTGNLDEETGAKVEDLLFDLNKQKGTTLVVVTHNMELARKAGRIIELKSGKLIRDQKLELESR